MIQFKPLASSSEGNSYLVTCEGHRGLLIDAGLTYAQLQVALNFELTKLAGCLITHSHQDHCRAVPSLVNIGAKVYAHPKTIETFKLKYNQRAYAVSPEKVFDVGDWRVFPFSAVHDVDNLGYYIQSPENDRLLVLTDTAYSPLRFDGLTHVAVEANHDREIVLRNVMNGMDPIKAKRSIENHMSVETMLNMLSVNDLSKLQEVHLLHLSDGNSDEVDFKRRVERLTGVPCYIAAKRA